MSVLGKIGANGNKNNSLLIASKIELYSSNEDTNTVTDVTKIAWEYLGYITLSDNQSSSFKSRELKSAKVPTCTATFIKLKLGKNHNNSYNTYNQAGVLCFKNKVYLLYIPGEFNCYQYFGN